MFKRKLKKILIILLLVIMIVQIVPISYAGNDLWESMEEDQKLQAVMDLSGGIINEDNIREFLNKYGLTPAELYQYIVDVRPTILAGAQDLSDNALRDMQIEQLLQATEEIQQNGTTNVDSSETETIGEFIDGIAGVLFIGIKILPAAIGKVLSLIMNGVSGEDITIYNVLFNKVGLTSINFFDSTTGSSTVATIKENVAIWYVGIRNLAAVILALILIYVAIRMAISTIAEDKAKYKTMLIDWITSLCLLFVLHYIMIFTINLNNTLVDLLSKAGNSFDLSYVEEILFGNAIFGGFIEGLGNSIAYMMLVGMSFIYFFSYVRRMITLAFLIIIAPLITVTYSIDKMGDGKSQALNTWLREFVYNILIQPFQCIIYLSLVTSVLGLLTGSIPNTAKVNLEQENNSNIRVASIENEGITNSSNNTNIIIENNNDNTTDTIKYSNIIKIDRASGTEGGNGEEQNNSDNGGVSLINVFITVYVLMFMYQAEEIVKKIFGFQAESMGKTLAAAAITTTLISRGTSLFKGGQDNKKVGAPTPYKKRPTTPRASGTEQIANNAGQNTTQQTTTAQNGLSVNSNGGTNNGANSSQISTVSNMGPAGTPGATGGNKTPKRNIGGVSKGLAGKLFRANIQGGLILAGLALGLSTGDLQGGVAGFGLGNAASGAATKAMDKRRDKRNEKLRQAQIARDIDEYQSQHGFGNNEVYQTVGDWLDGTSVPDENDDAALQLYQHLMEHRDGLEESGLSQDDARESLDRLLQNTFSGTQSRNDPESIPQRARRAIDDVGGVIERMKNRFTNNGGNP